MLGAGYGVVFRTVLLRTDPETAHRIAFAVIRLCGVAPVAAVLSRLTAAPASAAVHALGRIFPSPFGLAAGFDKNARAVAGLAALGFGHIEVGTITLLPQPGNPPPRLVRLPADAALINRMGFNNEGAMAVARRLAAVRRRPGAPVVGVNIGKNRDTPMEQAAADYAAVARALAPVADYLVVNVSSPNTPGLRGLQELDLLEPLLAGCLREAGGVPVLVKIAPDLTDDAVRHIAALVGRIGLAGVVATNTTLARTGLRTSAERIDAAGAGGVSGAPLAARSRQVLGVLRDALPASACIISVGGVMTAADVRERLAAGATLVQGYTGFLYRGPGWPSELSAA
ncbi:quinone-dependent dihydroorotate dehydrogenase [uncultured Amnibacterium sp.]|uniref:quinone-dependent dihydroorotate dehydrogenase n=1 Tax=uncultured Amnibacterium sp. TaxID=1631851 RepID=UPI0035C996D0